MFRELLLLLAAASLLLPGTSSARLTRLVITQTVPLAGGVAWGSTGPYERLTGTAYFGVDSNHPRNAVIVDVDNAPRNSHGMVEFSKQFMIVKPVGMSLGYEKLFYGVNYCGDDVLIVGTV